MKLFPLLGALLLSTAPVQGFETYEELDKACLATEENTNLCEGAGDYVSSSMVAYLLCESEEKGILTTEEIFLDKVNKIMTENNASPMWNAGAENMLESFPECSLKPVP